MDFSIKLINWYNQNKRDLPWRNTCDPYKIWLSEIILQQTRVNQGLPIIDKAYNSHLGWQFLFTMKQNEMFVFPNEKTGFNPHEIDLLDPANKKQISPNLFRVQKIATKNYMFRCHLETNVEELIQLRDISWISIRSTKPLLNIIKVRLNHLGDIIHTGE